ncbi:threonine--tRNA ligase [Candidatus Leptofilum sp.]|uniref:threonine--tRNA ligase n=1 Tax=Candidatus Leptofilum sp. TaxID=3241576 RepID=UPI003B5A0D18
MSENYEQSHLYKLRHTAAHVLAQAVLELYPQAKLGIGPPIADGFYYDFDLGIGENGRSQTFHPDDLPKLEKRMRQIIAEKHPLVYEEVSVDEVRQRLADQPYKLELINELAEKGEQISLYQHDSFVDLCRGPHVAHTGKIPAAGLKLMSIAGAYWRGDEKRPQLQRIYGTAWPNKKELKNHLAMLEEAKKRDHRKLGRELEIFILDEDVGSGLPLWLPNGNILREESVKLANEMEDKAGYVRVATPHIAKESLYLQSGHLPYYADEMYPVMERDGSRYYLKPMNCPFHHKIYASKPRSYRDLPLRLSEYGMVYRYEQSGTLMGLLRVRSIEQNDAHIYCAESQLEEEFMGVINLYRSYFELFGIEKYVMRLSKHSPEKLGVKYVDNGSMWLKAERIIRETMLKHDVPFVEAEDEAAFYGPKIDVQIWSAIGREFSLATNQLDFGVPPRFDLTFTNAQGELETPWCIHRAPLGAHERFIGFLIEHYAGNFPVWLAPEQVRVIPITDGQNEYAQQVAGQLKASGVRAQAMLESDRMQAKIRAAQQMKVPYMLVVGEREAAAGTVSLRKRDGSRQNGLALAAFEALVAEKIARRDAVL